MYSEPLLLLLLLVQIGSSPNVRQMDAGTPAGQGLIFYTILSVLSFLYVGFGADLL